MSATRRARTDVGGFGASGASEWAAVPGAIVETGLSGSRCVDALLVAINQAFDTRKWYTATKELQLASLELCEACRSTHAVHLTVDGKIPTTLLGGGSAPHASPEGGVSSRVPRLRARRVTWQLPSVELLSNPIDTFADVEELHLGNAFNGSLDARAWPSRLRKIEFGRSSCFNQPIDGVAWPASLQELRFGGRFNQPIQGVKWPASLRVIVFGDAFDQPIEGVKWPKTLQQLVFGRSFNHPVEASTWPTTLHQLKFGGEFNRSIEGVTWPKFLREVTFGLSFNQPIERVAWPTFLHQVTFGGEFNQSIEGVRWPMSLRKLTFGVEFNQPIDGVAWPPSLEELAFGIDFDQSLEGVQWPSSLRRFRLRGRFCQSLQKLGAAMPSLEQFALQFWGDAAHRYDLLSGIKWPAGLTSITISRNAYIDWVEIPSTVSISYSDGFGW